MDWRFRRVRRKIRGLTVLSSSFSTSRSRLGRGKWADFIGIMAAAVALAAVGFLVDWRLPGLRQGLRAS